MVLFVPVCNSLLHPFSAFWTVSTSIGIPLDGTGGAGLGGTGGRVDRGRRNIERGADRGRAEHAGAIVVDWSVD